MNRQVRSDHRPRHLQVLAGLVLVAASCHPVPRADAGITISCGSIGLTSPTVDITLDSTSALTSGRLALEPLAGNTMTLHGAVVEITTPGVWARCEAPGGKFRIAIRGDTAVDGTLRIAAKQSVRIVVHTAAGVERAVQSFDPRSSSPTQLTWSAATR